MAAASWAHIWKYCASVAAIAGVFCPRTLVATSAANWARLAAMSGGGTVAANAASNAPAAASACAAVCSACAAVALIHATCGMAAAAMDAAAGPNHSSQVNAESTASYEKAVARNSAANPFQADAAASIGPDPAPVYIRAELISGGNAAKSSTAVIGRLLNWLGFPAGRIRFRTALIAIYVALYCAHELHAAANPMRAGDYRKFRLKL